MTLNGHDIKTAIVAGAIANKYGNGGEPWIRLSWIAGLRRLGYRVLFIEQVPVGTRIVGEGDAPIEDDGTHVVCLDWYRRILDGFRLRGCAALIGADGRDIDGVTYDDALEFARSADVLVNISGHLTLPALKDAPRRKLFIDEDPGFTQFWYSDGTACEHVDGHDVYFTLGRNIGRNDCPIPTCGFRWLPLRTPVVLEQWPICTSPAGRDLTFTTVGNWRGPFGVIGHGAVQYGLKLHEFRKFIELPRRVSPPAAFEAALKIHPADERDLASLRNNGWRVVNPRAVTADPRTFRQFVQSSSAEFSVAQGVYVGTNSGWFSDRTTRYLASGKPALVQDTGLSRELPTGEGLIAFTTVEEAVAGAERICSDYARHARAARAIAERFFDSDRVLSDALEQVGLPALAVN